MLFVGMALVGCAQLGLPRSGRGAETATARFQTGMTYFDQGNNIAAEGAFREAIALDSSFARGWAGIGLALAYGGNLGAGKQAVDLALNLAPEDPLVWVLHGRFWLVRPRRSGWLQHAQEDFGQALGINPDFKMALYYQGEAHFHLGEYEKASSLFADLSRDKSAWGQRAGERLVLTQRILMAEPQSVWARNLAPAKRITRAEWAVLLAAELGISRLLEDRANLGDTLVTYASNGMVTAVVTPQDAMGHWAEHQIGELVSLGVMVTDPSDNFNPDRPMTRQDVGIILQRMLIRATGSVALETRYLDGGPSRFPDVPKTHSAYNALVLAAESGVLTPDPATGAIHPLGAVSGVDALHMVRALERTLLAAASLP